MQAQLIPGLPTFQAEPCYRRDGSVTVDFTLRDGADEVAPDETWSWWFLDVCSN